MVLAYRRRWWEKFKGGHRMNFNVKIAIMIVIIAATTVISGQASFFVGRVEMDFIGGNEMKRKTCNETTY